MTTASSLKTKRRVRCLSASNVKRSVVRYGIVVRYVTLVVYSACFFLRALVLILNGLDRNVSVRRGKGTSVNVVKTLVSPSVRLL